MAELELIAPPKSINVTFSLDPARNAINSMVLLNDTEDMSGFDEWIYQTARAMSPEQLATNRLVLVALNTIGQLGDGDWPSFPAWLNDLSGRDPYAIRDHELDALSARANKHLGEELTPTQLLADRTLFLSIIERLTRLKGDPAIGPTHDDTLVWEKAHALLKDPPTRHELMVTHLQTMWDEFVASEWERRRPMLEEAVAAFSVLDFGGMSSAEIIRRVTERDLPPHWEHWKGDIEQLVFIPSAHIGPYLLLIGLHEGTARIVFRARTPEGVSARSPALSRSELFMRLSALANDTRLSILQLLAKENELSTQDVMDRLGLSQSAASRHLNQLSASGYLTISRHDGVKHYRLNRDRVNDTMGALKEFL